MATAQKRGFRFPWGGDPGRDPDSSARSDDEPSLAERLGAIPDDLGAGPFDLNAAHPDDQPVAEPEVPEAVESVTVEPVAVEPEPDAAPDAVEPEPPMAEAGAQPAAVAAELEPQPAPRAAWPESDRRSARTAATNPPADVPADPPAPKPAAKANPLVTGLVRAMRDAAKVARDEAVTGLRTDAAARAEAIRTDAAAAVADLRKVADADVAAIREWSKAEMARIREETEARIAARKEQLVAETDDHHAATEQTLASLAAAVAAYESEAGAFFDALLAEDDPARLAGLAERMPAPPALDAFPNATDDAARSAEPRAKRAPKAAEPEPDDRTVAGTPDTPVDSQVVEAPEASEPDMLDAATAAAAEAEALAGLDGQTQVIVSGLTSVASIATFKGGLMKAAGVSAVSVNAGNDGDCLFTVTHTGDTDVRLAVRELDPFETRLIADDGATLVVVAHEPAA